MAATSNEAKSGAKAHPLSSPDCYFACDDMNVGLGLGVPQRVSFWTLKTSLENKGLRILKVSPIMAA
jgi:hypothetical protein